MVFGDTVVFLCFRAVDDLVFSRAERAHSAHSVDVAERVGLWTMLVLLIVCAIREGLLSPT